LRRVHRWVMATTRIRLGQEHDGFGQLDRVRRALFKAVEEQQERRQRWLKTRQKEGKEEPPPPLSAEEVRENLEGPAAVCDLGQFLCRGAPSHLAVESAIHGLGACTRQLTLPPKLSCYLREQHQELQQCPKKAQEIFAAIRASVLVPVPDLLAERLLGPQKAAQFQAIGLSLRPVMMAREP
jgi:hypothetical protein